MAENNSNDQLNEQEERAAGLEINTDENQSGTTHLNEPLEENGGTDTELEKIKAELADAKDKYLRLAAEFDNFRRRSSKERVELIQTAGKEVIAGMLEVLDDADRAQKQTETASDITALREGVNLVFNKLRANLQTRGLKAMESIGTEFDADLHEAITEIPAPTEDLKGKVVDEVMKGYYLNEKLIRHAKVVVGK